MELKNVFEIIIFIAALILMAFFIISTPYDYDVIDKISIKPINENDNLYAYVSVHVNCYNVLDLNDEIHYLPVSETKVVYGDFELPFIEHRKYSAIMRQFEGWVINVPENALVI